MGLIWFVDLLLHFSFKFRFFYWPQRGILLIRFTPICDEKIKVVHRTFFKFSHWSRSEVGWRFWTLFLYWVKSMTLWCKAGSRILSNQTPVLNIGEWSRWSEFLDDHLFLGTCYMVSETSGESNRKLFIGTTVETQKGSLFICPPFFQLCVISASQKT